MIGVCIKYFHANYGGMLQAYATCALLDSENYEYELIRYGKKRTTLEKVKSLPRLFNHILLNDKYEALVKKLGEMTHPEVAKNNRTRLDAFSKFREMHFTKMSDVYATYRDLCDGAGKYSAVMTGSDQLWSPAGLPTNFYNLMFVPEEIRKISFASSFGVKEIPWYQRKRTKEYLERIPYISMRENRGAEIVRELTGRTVPVLMDPVFYFDKQQWETLIPMGKPQFEDYIFCYFLGSNPEHRKVAARLAEETGKKIVTLRHLDRYVPEDESFGDYAPYDVGPVQFLNLLRNAAMVCTDSFHGSAFSIIHEKQFVVFDRYENNSRHSKNSRIDSLCFNLGLGNRRWSADADIVSVMNDEIPYDAVQQKLAGYRQNMKDYLTEALS